MSTPVSSTTDKSRGVAARPSPVSVELIEADTPDRLDEVRKLFLAYAAELGGHICFVDLREKELPGLPGAYGRPAGRLLLALVDGTPAACAALKLHTPGVAEIKRLFVRPEFRRLGLGRRLAERIIAEAKALGHRRLILDTLPSMKAAQALYQSLGFRCLSPLAPETPIEMELLLDGGPAATD